MHRIPTACVVVGAALSIGCGGGSSRTVGSGSTGAGVSSTTSSTAPVASGIDSAKLVRDYEARKQAYLLHAAQGGGRYAQIARLTVGAPFQRGPIDDLCDFMDSRQDTADFRLTTLLRLVYLHGQDPAIPSDLRDRIDTTLKTFRYWIDEPNPDDMVFWSENHQILFASGELLAGQLFPQDVFPNSGLTGSQHMAKARPRILAWLNDRLAYGFSEWSSPVYYPHDVAPLLNLIDFAQDPELQTRAAMVMDALVFDLARQTIRGSFGVTAGRTYVEQKLDGRRQGIGDSIELLFGTRGSWRAQGTTDSVSLATSTYRVPHLLLAVGVDKDRPRYVERTRQGLTFAEGPAHGRGFNSFEDGMFWWGQGGYLAPETIVVSRDMMETWGLWSSSTFGPFSFLRSVPEPLLPGLSQTISPVSRGTVLAGAETYLFRTPDAQLSSVIDYQPGKVAFQQHAWQATLDLDAFLFTTAPGNLGRQPGPGRWTGSASLPRVIQDEDVALILYNPPAAQRLLFPRETHAYVPRAGFDEVVQQGRWLCARKGRGYVALYSAQPTFWPTTGAQAGSELIAPGMRNVWICQVGREAEDGSFADFVQAVTQAVVDVQGAGDGPASDPLTVRYEAPGLGTLRADWSSQPATRDGVALHATPAPRLETPYGTQAWGDPVLELQLGPLRLRHDRVAGTRIGEGL